MSRICEKEFTMLVDDNLFGAWVWIASTNNITPASGNSILSSGVGSHFEVYVKSGVGGHVSAVLGGTFGYFNATAFNISCLLNLVISENDVAILAGNTWVLFDKALPAPPANYISLAGGAGWSGIPNAVMTQAFNLVPGNNTLTVSVNLESVGFAAPPPLVGNSSLRIVGQFHVL